MAENTSILGIVGATTVERFTFVVRNAAVIDTVGPTAGVHGLGVAAESAGAGKLINIVVSGLVEVGTAEALDPGDMVTSNGSGLAVIADTAGNHIWGEYAPAPVNGAVPSSASGDRVRILLYSNKKTLDLA